MRLPWVELLVVISIIAVLAALILPGVSSVRKSAAATKCVSNLRQIGVQIHTYANDNNGVFPKLHYWDIDILTPLKDKDATKVWRCDEDSRFPNGLESSVYKVAYNRSESGGSQGVVRLDKELNPQPADELHRSGGESLKDAHEEGVGFGWFWLIAFHLRSGVAGAVGCGHD